MEEVYLGLLLQSDHELKHKIQQARMATTPNFPVDLA